MSGNRRQPKAPTAPKATAPQEPNRLVNWLVQCAVIVGFLLLVAVVWTPIILLLSGEVPGWLLGAIFWGGLAVFVVIAPVGAFLWRRLRRDKRNRPGEPTSFWQALKESGGMLAFCALAFLAPWGLGGSELVMKGVLDTFGLGGVALLLIALLALGYGIERAIRALKRWRRQPSRQ